MAGFEKNGGGAAVVEGGGFLLNNHPDILFFRPKSTMLWTKNMNGWMKRETRNENIRLLKRLTAEGVIRKDGVGRATFYVRNSSSGE